VPTAGSGITPTGNVTFTYGITAGSGQTFIGSGSVVLNGTGAATSASITLPPGSYTVTATYSGNANYTASSGTTGQTVTGVTALATTAPTGAGSSSASAPTFHTGTTFALTTVGTYTDGTHRSVSGLTYTGYTAAILTMDTSGNVKSLAPGVTTVTITAPGGASTTMTITVSASSGLTAPITQPVEKAVNTAIPGATVAAPQPTRKAGAGAGAGTPTPMAQPARR